GYGESASRFQEPKRVVFRKEVGPLLSMEEMTRCIHCTRCIRFGIEIGGVMELGMVNRGEHAEITTVVGDTIDSELSGNMIDICPVGAITSKPFRFSARTWELLRRKSVSPHDSTGANLVVQVKNNRVLRVVPLENEDVNECWIADRDRFSYEALDCDDRLTQPMLKQDGQWVAVDWQTALEYVANGLKNIKAEHGAAAIGLLASPHSTLEELVLAKALVNGLGSGNIDTRLRHADFTRSDGVRWLGTSIASLSTLNRVLVVGSNLRKDHPLFAQRIRQAARAGCAVSAINSVVELGSADAWAMPVANTLLANPGGWAQALADVAAAVAAKKGVAPPAAGRVTDEAAAIAASLLGGERRAILLGNAAAHHARANSLLALAQWIGAQTGASVGYLTEAANTVGAQWVGALPGGAAGGGMNAAEMLSGALQGVLLLATEPEFDSAAGAAAKAALGRARMVVTLSPFKANLDFSDVLLPIAPFTETSGTFVNAEGRLQSFQAVVPSLGETRPAWKVLRVLANLLGLSGFDYESSQAVVEHLQVERRGEARFVPAERLGNTASGPIDLSDTGPERPAVASIYQLDGLVRRASSLQLTADARAAAGAHAATDGRAAAGAQEALA
ncbi:MAG: molybdopterin-dependent oxidoreductase, partial [Proteobacteria bacterium]|nr:molybdopterin-dependent oxidoreductase [Pseudomonadota bacterium]